MGSIVIVGLVGGATNLINESTAIPEDLKPSMISAVEDNARFLSDEELTAILKDASPDLSQKVLRVNEIVRIHGIKASLWGLVVFAILGIIVSIFLPSKILVHSQTEI
ncbi:hypothetical protein [Methanosarcina sp. DH1]|uniref:hypothetical protein n=1 Tax=Methanosarcina sp. DH1 TaxID=2605695 RepID=UPI001E2DF17C|nr:hypothetical protein [Methanosarcina sp. DH1]